MEPRHAPAAPGPRRGDWRRALVAVALLAALPGAPAAAQAPSSLAGAMAAQDRDPVARWGLAPPLLRVAQRAPVPAPRPRSAVAVEIAPATGQDALPPSPEPRPRGGAAAARAAAADAGQPRPSGIAATAARVATTSGGAAPRETSLLGVVAGPDGRTALLRLSDGSVRRVRVGDRIDGMTVAAVSDASVQLTGGEGRRVLTLPGR